MKDEYSDLIVILRHQKEGFSLRDLLIGMQNYYLEAAENGVQFITGEDSLSEVEQMYIDLGSSFCNFSKTVKAITLSLKAGIDVMSMRKRMEQLSIVKAIEEQTADNEMSNSLRLLFI